MTSVFSFLRNELSNEQLLEHKPSEYAEKREKVYMFLRLPLILEKFMFYGFMQCCDSFLYIFAFVPLRICFLLLRIIFYPFRAFFNYARIFEKPQMVDAIKFILIVACVYTLTFIDTSMVYHIIRGQAIIKLYIFFNMLEVADRLLCSIGQDILDALLYTVIEPNKSKIRAIPHLFIAIIYMFVHSMIILCQATTLNVAFNSHNKALLTIMMSNNFVELKGSVFKKFDINNLFQMSCSDAKERFQNLILLLVVLIRNMTEFDWEMDQLYEMIPVFCMVFFSEFLIDWIKIAFVLKFNNISYEVFNDFKLDLARNYIESKKKKVLFDVQIRSYGFVPLPLFCLFLRVCAQSIQLNVFLSYFNVFIGFLCILMLKMLVSLIIFGLSCKWIEKLGSGTSGEGGEKPQVHVLPAEPTEEPKEPILLVNDEDINDVTFTGIHELKSEESLQNESLLKDIEKEPDEKAAGTGKRPIKMIVSGNLRTRRIILFSNSTKFSIKKAHIKSKKPVRG